MWNLVRAELIRSKELLAIIAGASVALALGAWVYYDLLGRATPERWNWEMLSNGLGTALIPYITLHWHMVSNDQRQLRRRHWLQSGLGKGQIGWSRNLYLLAAGPFSAVATTLVLYAPLQVPFGQRLVLWFSIGGLSLCLAFLIRLTYQLLRPKTDYLSLVVLLLILQSNMVLQLRRNAESGEHFDHLSRQLYTLPVCLSTFALAALIAYLTQQVFVRRHQFA